MRRAGPLLRPSDEPLISRPRTGRVSERGPHSQPIWGQILKKQVLVTVDRGETRVGILEAEGEPTAAPAKAEEKPSGRRRRGRSRGGQKQQAPNGWRVSELYIERRHSRSIVGNIYKGKVDNVLPGLEAAFVDIGLEKNGFLHVDDIVMPGVEVARRGRTSGKGAKIAQ